MLNQPRKPGGFGVVDDKPRCPNCRELTFLTRRAPAAEHALEYEQQTFTCFDVSGSSSASLMPRESACGPRR